MRLAFVDLETTGGSPVEDRITEVGIIEVDLDDHGSGLHPVREWSALVNPDAPIPPFIETLTGITNAMVADAPRFEELADDILARLDGRLFIAHNARFDHGFLKNAFRRIDRPFRPPVLCTVRLSRKLYPGYARHNLDTLIERHRLTVDMRHRAIGDARLLWQLWQKLHAALPADEITKAIDQLTARPSLPRHLDPDVLDTLPKSAGVYLFHGGTDAPETADREARRIDEAVVSEARRPVEQVVPDAIAGHESTRTIEPIVVELPLITTRSTTRPTAQPGVEEPSPALYESSGDATGCTADTIDHGPPPHVEEPRPLYIGKAKNLRQRVMAHFTGDHLSAREMEISQQMTRIEWIETGGGTQHDLGALLMEATLVKQRMPAYNRQLRKNEDVCAWRLVIDREPPHACLRESDEGRALGPLGPSLYRPRRFRPGWKLALARPDDLFFAVDPDLYGPFATPRQAGVALRAIADAHGLCPAVLKLEKAHAGKPCFSHQVKRCHGACVGLETEIEHAWRLRRALASTALRPWPFAGAIAFREGRTFHVVDGWAYLGMAGDLDAARRLAIVGRPFDHDVYRLLMRRIDDLEAVRLDA